MIRNEQQQIVAFVLYKVTPFGLKAGLGGGLKTISGAAKSLILFQIAGFNEQGVFGEISDALEDKILKDVPVVPLKQALGILKAFGKNAKAAPEADHYFRKIGALGLVKKVMVGRPNP